MIDAILDQAESIAETPESGPNQAAMFLAPYRIQAATDLQEDITQLKPLLSIITAQVRYLTEAGLPDKATAVAEWFIHTLHHLSENDPEYQISKLQMALRSLFAAFFRHYARALRNVDRIEDMRIAMRTSMDLSRDITMSVVFLVHLYAPLIKENEVLENTPAKKWILDRYAECLAAMDYAGLHDTPFRTAMDKFQLAMYNQENIKLYFFEISKLATEHPDDIAIKTLKNLFEKQYITSMPSN